jgi:hypothetical protein
MNPAGDSWNTVASLAARFASNSQYSFDLSGLQSIDGAFRIVLGSVPGVSAMRPLQRLGHPGLCCFCHRIDSSTNWKQLYFVPHDEIIFELSFASISVPASLNFS